MTFPRSLLAGQERKHVFVLNSYHQGYPFTDKEMRGIFDVIDKSDIKVHVYVTYMDTKRIPITPQYLSQIKQLIKIGYKGLRFDTVLAADNDALAFMRKNRDELFPGVPVVFMGINDFNEPMLDGRRDITGVTENADYAGTIRIALKLRPATKNIVVVTDNTTTGKAHRSEIEKIRPDFLQRLSFIYLSLADTTLDELAQALSKLESDSIVLLVQHFVDKNGISHSIEEGTLLLAKSSSVPVFVTTDSRMGLGVLGGHVIGGYFQGEAAAQITLQILKGADVSSIPRVLKSPNRYMFDYRVMQRFNIAENDLPPESILINKPVSILDEYRPHLIIIASTFIVLCGVLAYLLIEIRKRKQAEEELKESREQFRAVVEKSPISLALVNMKGDIEYINLKAIETFGYLPQDIPNMDRWWAQAYPDKTYRDRVVAQWMGLVAEALLNKHEIQKREYRVTCKDGAVKIIDIYGVWVGDKVLAVFDNITDRMQAEEALRSSEARFRTIIEQANTGIQVVDIKTRQAIYANPEICRILGYTEQELRSIPVTALAVDDEQLNPEEDFDQHVRNESHPSERTFRRKNGSLVRISIHSILMEIDGRQCLVGFMSDASEKHLLEEERLKTQKLEAVGTLAGGIAHDFNNLLQGIFGYISLAKLRKDDREKSIAALEEAEKALHMSVKLTNQLLTFSKGGTPVKHVIDPIRLIESTVKFALSGSRTNFQISADSGLWRIDADEGQISQVIQNIVLNADQAMPDAGQIQITAKNVQAPGPKLPQELMHGRYVEIAINDSGIGIPERYLHRIFDPYFTTKEKGSGLGLATSYSIIKNHNGVIDVASDVGKGTMFRIYIPASTEPASDIQSAPVMAASGKKGRILVMDDEELILNVARELLEALGHEVEFAANGTEALKKYQEAQRSAKPFDIAIIDLTIRGGMGGAETLKKLLAIDPKAKAVVSSGYSEDSAIDSYENQGFKAVLKKPYNVDELQKVLNRLLNT